MDKPFCISTLDLVYYGHGGVVTKALMFAEFAKEEGFAPFFITPSVPLHRTFRRALRGENSVLYKKTEFAGYPCHQFAALYPEWEPHAHRFDYHELKHVLQNPLPCFAISGNNHASRPFLDLGYPYSMWPGSTFWEDCKDRVLSAPMSIRKLLDLASKSSCERLETTLFQNAHEIIADTTYTRSHILKLNSSWAQKTIAVPVPIQTEKYKPAEAPSRKHLIFLGRMSDPRKNLPLLLNAFESISEKCDLNLVLIGSGDEEFERRLAIHPQSQRIKWVQHVSEDDKIKFIQNALALVIPSHQEGFGIVGAEALACGVPVISTPCGGTHDFVITDETGILLKTFEASEMAEAIQKVKATASTWSTHCRDFAVKKLSYDAVRPQLKKFIHGNLSNTSS